MLTRAQQIDRLELEYLLNSVPPELLTKWLPILISDSNRFTESQLDELSNQIGRIPHQQKRSNYAF